MQLGKKWMRHFQCESVGIVEVTHHVADAISNSLFLIIRTIIPRQSCVRISLLNSINNLVKILSIGILYKLAQLLERSRIFRLDFMCHFVTKDELHTLCDRRIKCKVYLTFHSTVRTDILNIPSVTFLICILPVNFSPHHLGYSVKSLACLLAYDGIHNTNVFHTVLSNTLCTLVTLLILCIFLNRKRQFVR